MPEPGAKKKVALIVPLTGIDGPIGTSISRAAALALTDTGNQQITLTVFDSAKAGAASAATLALANGNALILGPLTADDVRAVGPLARRAGVPVVAFSNDRDVAGDGVFIMGTAPSDSIDRTVRYARSKGAAKFGGVVPTNLFGQVAIGYLAITLPLIGLVNYAERRLRSGLVGVTVGGGA